MEADALSVELQTLNDRAKAHFRAGEFAEALPLAGQFAMRTKETYGAESLWHLLALANVKATQDAALARLKELGLARDFANALKLADLLVESTRVFGADRGRNAVAQDFRKVIAESHERDFNEQYLLVGELSMNGAHAAALQAGERLMQLGAVFEARSPDRYADALTAIARIHIDMLAFRQAEPLFKQAVDLLARMEVPPILARGYQRMIADRREQLAQIYSALEEEYF